MFGLKKKKLEDPVRASWNQKVYADLNLLLVPDGADVAVHLGQDLVGIKLAEQAGNKKYVKIATDNFTRTSSVKLFQTLIKLPKMQGAIRPIRSAFVNLLATPSCPIIACWIVLSGKEGEKALSAIKEIIEADGDPEIKKLFADLEGLTEAYRNIFALREGKQKKNAKSE